MNKVGLKSTLFFFEILIFYNVFLELVDLFFVDNLSKLILSNGKLISL